MSDQHQQEATDLSVEPTPQPQEPEDETEAMLMTGERSYVFETRVERASMCRDRGSAQFKLKNIARAVEWYERALYHVDFDEGTWHFEFLDKHRAAVNEVRLPVYLNLAACYLNEAKLDPAKVVENADLALAIDQDNTKALYRGGKAHLLLGDVDKARDKLRKAAQRQPSDRNIREALQEVATILMDQKEKDKKTWGGHLLVKGAEDQPATAAANAETDTTTVVSSSSQSMYYWIALVATFAVAVAAWAFAV